MSLTVCLAPRGTLAYPEGGGHLWVFLNWTLGLRVVGCRVIWLEVVPPNMLPDEVETRVAALRLRLAPFGLADSVALCSGERNPPNFCATNGCLDLDAASAADLLLNFKYNMPSQVLRRFRRTALVDIDPGLLQTWMADGQLQVPAHDMYFTIGETVGKPNACFPDGGVRWEYTPPCVALDWWPPSRAPDRAAFTTVAHWYATSWSACAKRPEDKRSSFLPFLELPRRTIQVLELALDLDEDDEHWSLLRQRGWRVRDAHEVAPTPCDYQRYIQQSLGEFSCAKASCMRLENAWVSDRTLCYLASGKPAVVQHTGQSRFLPDASGLFRFHDLDSAVACLERVAADYKRQSTLARQLAEEYFDARKVVTSVLDRALV